MKKNEIIGGARSGKNYAMLAELEKEGNAVLLEIARGAAKTINNELSSVLSEVTITLSAWEWLALVQQFNRLDAAEQKRQVSRIQQGHHGKKGGRPKKNQNPM